MEYKTTVEQDIKAAIKIMDGKKVYGYDKIYSWTNEVLPSYFNYRRFQTRRACCPTSSGDHLAHASLAGANYIDAFDNNPLTKYYASLKIAILRTYDYSHMCQFLFKPFVNKNINLNDISWNLTEKQLYFWREVFKHQSYDNYNLYHQDNQGYYTPMEQNCIFFFDEGSFKRTQKSLESTKIVYHDINITSPNETKELTGYDVIFLSNIHEYTEYNSLDILYKNCSELLLPNGTLYQYHCMTEPTDNHNKKNKYLEHEDTIITIKDVMGKAGSNCGVNVYRKK